MIARMLALALLHRDLAVTEDNDISLNQQLATHSPQLQPGPYHTLEFAVHRFDNLVLDKVLQGEASLASKREAEAVAMATPAVAMAGGAVAALGASAPTTANRVSMMPTNAGLQSVGARRLMATTSSAPFALSPGSAAPVCVTGANGFIALHLVEQLLLAGYRVTAAVRTDDATKLAPLTALGALGELDIVSGCNLLVPGSFDNAVRNTEVRSDPEAARPFALLSPPPL